MRTNKRYQQLEIVLIQTRSIRIDHIIFQAINFNHDTFVAVFCKRKFTNQI